MDSLKPSYDELLRECAHLHRQVKQLEEELQSKKRDKKSRVKSNGQSKT